MVLLNKTQFKEALMGMFELVESGTINGGYIFAFFDECNQEKLLPIQEQSKLTWKALAEAHLRERVKNPHNYRALSIELEGMKNAGFDWSKEYNLASLVRFLSRLYSTQISYQALWSKFETFTDTHTYQIQDATNYWNNYR